jgi:TPR repeat protein
VRRIRADNALVISSFGANDLRPARADALIARPRPIPAAIMCARLARCRRRAARQRTAQRGFMYENGFGVPQAYDAAADFYQRAAVQGEPLGRAGSA